MRRARSPLLLPVTGFRPGLVLPARRPRRNNRVGSQCIRELVQQCRLQGIRHHYMTALRQPGAAASKALAPHRRTGNDVTLPREAAMGSRVGCAFRLSEPCAEAFEWPDMPETLITPFSRWILACAALLGVSALSIDAWAQMSPVAPPPQAAPVNPLCPRLEAQLATIDRGGGSGDPAKDDQIRRYQDAASKQQGELDPGTSQAKRMGCDSTGFFSLFSGQSAQCGPGYHQR